MPLSLEEKPQNQHVKIRWWTYAYCGPHRTKSQRNRQFNDRTQKVKALK